MHKASDAPASDDDMSRSSPQVDFSVLETYQQSPSDEIHVIDRASSHRTLFNFVGMSILFSANHACAVACLALATARLGEIGAWQSGVLYICYTGSALFGATYVVKHLGARDALVVGMACYCIYVGAFWGATVWHSLERPVALSGAAVGGVGAGFLWTAQGSYFVRAAQDHARELNQRLEASTAYLASIFAFFYLSLEVLLRSLPSILLKFGMEWSTIFAIYAMVTVGSTVLMIFVHNYSTDSDEAESTTTNQVWYKVTAAWQLLRRDTKMKYMIGLNAVFGFTAAFLNSYVNGEVVSVVMNDTDSMYVGLLTAWLAGVAAAMSLVFGRVSQRLGKGPVLILGAVCFAGVALPFVLQPNLERWTWSWLVLIYTLHGTGRATFEGTLKATFADYFLYEKEGAFANIILQNGLSSAIGYVLTFRLLCTVPSTYCVEYKDGSLHDVLSFELLILVSAVLAVAGLWRASALHEAEVEHRGGDQDQPNDEAELLENEEAVSG